MNKQNESASFDLSNQRLSNAEEVARFLGVPVSWIYERTRRNAIPMIRLGKYVRFNIVEIAAWAKADRS